MLFDCITRDDVFVIVPINEQAREWMAEYSEDKYVLVTKDSKLVDATNQLHSRATR